MARKEEASTPLTKLEKSVGRMPPLKRADIILIRHKHNLLRSFLRRYMGSYWDHTALILYPSEVSRGRQSHVLIESIQTGTHAFYASRGVAIHLLGKYLNHPELYDVGIKRVPGLTDDERIRVTHFMLMNVDAPYWPWKHLTIALAAFIPAFKRSSSLRQRFSCSGIIQQAYYDTLNWDEKARVVFKAGAWSPIELQELTSPGDIGSSTCAEWIYNEH
jgi:hypothetical protein